MFKDCTIKYLKDHNDKNYAVKIIYPVDSNGVVKKLSVPLDNENTDYQNILAWVAEGNTIAEAD